MIDEPQVAMAASPREWAPRLHRHLVDHGGARVRATVLHPQEALTESYDVLVVDDTTSYLTPRLLSELRRCGRRVLGVYDGEDPRGKGELLELGVDEVLSHTAATEEFIEAIATLAADRYDRVQATPATSPPAPNPRIASEPARGRLIAVGGPCGGPGVTEVAVGLATVVGRRGEPCVLVDADDVAPCLAQRLGLPSYPNLRAAVDAVEHLAGTLAETLTPVRSGRFWLLPGLSRGADWAHVRPNEVQEVTRQLTRRGAHVLVNVGHRLDDLTATGGPPRYATTRALLGAADAVVAVGVPTPVGVARLVEWVADLQAVAAAAPLHLVVNRTCASGFKRAQVEAELRRSVTPASVTIAPEDKRVPAAAWSAGLVACGPFTRAIGELAAAALPSDRAAQGRRGLHGRLGRLGRRAVSA